jgi:hypothetical protein
MFNEDTEISAKILKGEIFLGDKVSSQMTVLSSCLNLGRLADGLVSTSSNISNATFKILFQ